MSINQSVIQFNLFFTLMLNESGQLRAILLCKNFPSFIRHQKKAFVLYTAVYFTVRRPELGIIVMR